MVLYCGSLISEIPQVAHKDVPWVHKILFFFSPSPQSLSLSRMAVSDVSKPILNEEFDYEPMPDGCILFKQASGQIISLNPPAELILSFCDGETDIASIFTLSGDEMELDRETFDEVINSLFEQKVLLLPTD